MVALVRSNSATNIILYFARLLFLCLWLWTLISLSFPQVASANDAPVAADDTLIAHEDTPLVITGAGLLANDTDIDGDTLVITGLGQPIIDSGSAVVYNGDGTYTYTPGADFNGTDYLFYAVSDGQGGFDTATVTLIITPQNDAPTISGVPDTSIDEDTPYSFKPDADDIDGDPLTFSVINQPAWAVLIPGPI